MTNRNVILGGIGSLDTGIRLGQWIGQLVLAAIVPFLLWGLLLETAPHSTNARFGWVGNQIIDALEIAVLGFLMGVSVRVLFPTAKQVGRKIWIVPLVVLLFTYGCVK